MCGTGTEDFYDGNNLARVQGYYKNTDIQVSYLFKLDLQRFYWSEPMCKECLEQYTLDRDHVIAKPIINAVKVIQKFWSKYWSPPCIGFPKGGLGYRKAKTNFEAISKNVI
jgi:hypothetical protein